MPVYNFRYELFPTHFIKDKAPKHTSVFGKCKIISDVWHRTPDSQQRGLEDVRTKSSFPSPRITD